MTTNHDYNTPKAGTTDWNIPLNENFERIDTSVEIRDVEANLDQYSPKQDAKFLATDTGRRYLGDGSIWTEAPVPPRVVLPTRETDPSEPAVGNMWYRADTDKLQIQTRNGPAELTLQQGSGDENSDDGGSRTFQVSNDLSSDGDLDWFNKWYKNNASIAVSPTGDGNVMRVDCPAGENLGTQLAYDFRHGEPGHALDEGWGRYEVYFGPWDMSGDTYNDWEKQGKLPGFCVNEKCGMGSHDYCTGEEGMSARMGFGEGPTDNTVQLSSYTYYIDKQRAHFDWDMNGNIGAVKKGEWHTIDYHIDLGPAGGEGLIEGWVNGTKAIERPTRFRAEGAEWGIEEWWHNVWWGGPPSDPSPHDNVVYFRNLTLSDGPLN